MKKPRAAKAQGLGRRSLVKACDLKGWFSRFISASSCPMIPVQPGCDGETSWVEQKGHALTANSSWQCFKCSDTETDRSPEWLRRATFRADNRQDTGIMYHVYIVLNDTTFLHNLGTELQGAAL
ncbi:hypothetical protein PT974_02537 [Cladobotryum mycophilum]|uniref:Uncharacterized protein n=1 Tax=Cladobotryum mycophilum TaxID=491253 RepID=A0ABR0SYD3_9HYPO